MLCLVEHALERFLAGVALVLYVLCHMDELSLYGIFLYDISIVLDVGRGRHTVDESSHKVKALYFLRHILFL